MEYITLNNGVIMPQLGYGTFQQSGPSVADNVEYAIKCGYELIDTANRYGNEVEVGQGIKRSGVARDKIFLETKLGPTLYENEEAIDGTLKRLGVDYIDLMLLHHPVNNYMHAYGMLEKAHKAGKIRAIGLSNFSIEQIEEVLAAYETRPALMQVECHPYFPAEDRKPFLDEEGIRVQSWYPLGHGDSGLLNDPVFAPMAEKYGKSIPQIILRWHIQMGFGVIPGSRNFEHIKANLDIFDFSLTEEEMAEIAKVNRHRPFHIVTPESLHRLATTKCNFEQ